MKDIMVKRQEEWLYDYRNRDQRREIKWKRRNEMMEKERNEIIKVKKWK